jgi:hypothetical protein
MAANLRCTDAARCLDRCLRGTDPALERRTERAPSGWQRTRASPLNGWNAAFSCASKGRLYRCRVRWRTAASWWEDWAIGAALILLVVVGLGLLLSLWIDSIVVTVVGVALVGFLMLMRVVGAFGR